MKNLTNSLTARYFYMTLILIATLLLDQWTKFLVATSHILPLTLIQNFAGISPFTRIILHHNAGIAFSIPLPFPLILALIAALIFFGGRMLLREIDITKPLASTALAFVAAGTLGNLLDRIRLGYVIDFISIWKFAVFNIADAAIFCGIVMLVVGYSTLKRIDTSHSRG